MVNAKTKVSGLIYSHRLDSRLFKNQPFGFIVPAGKAPVEHAVSWQEAEPTPLSGKRREGLPGYSAMKGAENRTDLGLVLLRQHLRYSPAALE